jgi:hypothetical protein
MNVERSYIEQSMTNITLVVRRGNYVPNEIYEFNAKSTAASDRKI